MAELPVDGVPDFVKWAMYGAMVLGAALTGPLLYLRRPKTPVPEQMIIEGASISDGRPAREIAASLHGIHEELKLIRELRQAEAAEDEIETRAEERAELLLLRAQLAARRAPDPT